MKKLILAMAIISTSASAFAATKSFYGKKSSISKKKVAAKPQRPMKVGQKTIICGKSGATITSALSNINSEMAKPSVKSHTAKNLTIHRPFSAISEPVVHSEKRKRSADVYVACVKIKKV